MRQIILSILFLIPSISFSGTIDPQTPQQKYIDYGSKFKYVTRLLCIDKEGQEYWGSCVLIDDNHIITAAHVVESCESCYVELNDKQYLLSKVYIPKEYSSSKFGRADIALGYSENSFDLNFYPELYQSDDEDGKLCSLSGFGFTGTFLTGSKIYDDQRRAGSNFIDHIDEDLLICSPSKRNQKGFTSLEFLIASGDSGGGLFIDGKLAGIHSCIISSKGSPNSKYGEESGHTRVSKFLSWIQKNKIQKATKQQ